MRQVLNLCLFLHGQEGKRRLHTEGVLPAEEDPSGRTSTLRVRMRRLR